MVLIFPQSPFSTPLAVSTMTDPFIMGWMAQW
jgi:hypothetical protein